jgi:hypothetical protein
MTTIAAPEERDAARASDGRARGTTRAPTPTPL